MKAFKVFIKPFDVPQANQLIGFYMRATLAFNRSSFYFIFLPQFPFTINETELEYYDQEMNVRVAEQLKIS